MIPPSTPSTAEQSEDFVATCNRLSGYLWDPAWRETVRVGKELNDRLCLLAAARAHCLADDRAIVEAGDAARAASPKAVVHVADLLHQLGTVMGPGERDPLTEFDATFAALRRALPHDSIL